MNFDLTDEQREIKDTAKQFFGDRFRAEKVPPPSCVTARSG